MKQWISWGAVVGWMGLIFFLSHQPGDQSGQLSSGMTKQLIHIIQTLLPFINLEMETLHFFIRKGAHFFSYFVLAILIYNAILQSGWNKRLAPVYAWSIATVYAMTDEFHQLFIPGRSGEVRDVVIDSAGSLLGVALVVSILWMRKRLK
ncbi:VanZ family protein [Alkalihalobacillus pseudalcaliphilus]|uniref:VanZ family protein n=1 Tax=Alkalihalobacillus pseudalcaliphilus TaxID=79884 RepID=UPI00064E0F72|nr:VanZ family protein [Alkalihalobacillus pseudalcaliphilus]KMK77387.1 VanZ family protein [Alkalihalobacillus pseudalcaliphilus]